MPSVVIPAHNEATTIARLLDRLTRTMRPDEFEICVVCNGCTDNTAAIARSFPVTVVEISEASKTAALNVGDYSVQSFPRAYIDADVVVDASALRATFAALETGTALCAAPRLHLELRHSSLLVRLALRAWLSTPWQQDTPVGSGVYALSETGHERVAPLPSLIADDAYVASAFAQCERATLEHESFTAFAPRTLGDMLERRRRVQAGNRELLRRFPDRTAQLARTTLLTTVLAVFQRPEQIVGTAILTAVHLAAAWSTPNGSWGRDESSRQLTPAHSHRTTSSRLRRAFRSYLDPRVYLHAFRLLHFFGYTHARERQYLNLGKNVRFSPTVSIRNAQRISIGDDSAIGEYSALWAGDGTSHITIGARTLFGPGVVCTASDYGIQAGVPFRAQKKHEADITIGDDVWLGARVIVTAGVSIGSGCVVGAGAVVTKSLPDNSIAAGVPARVIGERPPQSDQEAILVERN